MKFKIKQTELSKAINSLIWVVERSHDQLTDNIYLNVSNDLFNCLCRSSTQWEEVRYKTDEVDIIEDWACMIPVQPLKQIVWFINEDTLITIYANKARTRIVVKAWKDTNYIPISNCRFWKVFDWALDIWMKFSKEDFYENIKKNMMCCSKNISRPILTWVNISSNWNWEVIFQATDAYRVSKTVLKVDSNEFNITLASKTLSLIMKSLKEIDWVLDFKFNDKLVRISCWWVIITAWLITWKFPNTNMIYASDELLVWAEFKFTSLIEDMVQSIKKSMVFTEKEDVSAILATSEELWLIEFNTKEIWIWNSTIVIDWDVKWNIEFWINISFLIEAIQTFKTESISICTNWPNKPVYIYDDNDRRFQYVIMPLKL